MKLGVRFELRLLPRGEGDRTEVVRAPAVLEASLGLASQQANNVRLDRDV